MKYLNITIQSTRYSIIMFLFVRRTILLFYTPFLLFFIIIVNDICYSTPQNEILLAEANCRL